MQHDPEFLEALQRIFASRKDIETIVEHQRRLFASIQELNTNHQAVAGHIRTLHESHGRLQDTSTQHVQARRITEDFLRQLDESHRQTREEVRQALQAIAYVQQEIRKIPELEQRLRAIERQLDHVEQDDRQDDRKVQEQEQRLRKLESRK